jgi:two-component system, response regulator, stage 0 sporulation protein F
MPTILIVEDEHDVLTAFRAVLRHAGYEVRTASTIPTALQVLDTERPDLVLLDIKLGNMDQNDGLDLLQQMRERVPHLKVVVVSAYLDLVTRQAALDGGALDCWPKPVTMQMLAERTAQVLAHTTG